MFNSISNNFGADTISFKDYQTEGLTILNTKFTLDPTCEEYLAADTLEITVPTLVMKKSAVTAAFVVSSEENNQYGTILKTWIKDSNTICIEKVDGWNPEGPWTIYILAAYVKLGVRTDVSVSGTLEPTVGNNTDVFRVNGFYATAEENWCYICFRFYTRRSLAHDQEFSYEFTGLPEDIDCDVPIVFEKSSMDNNGSPIVHGHIKGNTFTFYHIPSNVFSSNNGHFINVFIVRDGSSSDNQ